MPNSREFLYHVLIRSSHADFRQETPQYLSTKSTSVLAVKRHNGFWTRDVSKEGLWQIISRWTLSCFLTVLCILVAIRVTNFCRWDAYLCCLCCNILMEEVDKVEETSLVMSLKLSTRSVDSLETILILIRSELVLVNKTPSQCSNNIDSTQLLANVLRCNVSVVIGLLANLPSVLLDFTQVSASSPEKVAAVVDAAIKSIRWLRGKPRDIRIKGPEANRPVDVRDLLICQSSQVQTRRSQDLWWVLLAKEKRICHYTEDKILGSVLPLGSLKSCSNREEQQGCLRI
jgi:hypothetical protein